MFSTIWTFMGLYFIDWQLLQFPSEMSFFLYLLGYLQQMCLKTTPTTNPTTMLAINHFFLSHTVHIRVYSSRVFPLLYFVLYLNILSHPFSTFSKLLTSVLNLSVSLCLHFNKLRASLSGSISGFEILGLESFLLHNSLTENQIS